MRVLKIPEVTIERLSVYSRYLTIKKHQGRITTSSQKIAEDVGVNPAQVRKDLAYFGEFGTRGVGYNVDELNRDIIKILGLNKEWNAALVGFGHLGHALISYGGFQERGFHFTSIFDIDPVKIGTMVNGVEVSSLSRLEEVVACNNNQIGIITVPADGAQDIANSLVKAGVQAILNFAPVTLSVPENIELRNVDLTVNLEILSFNMESNHISYMNK